ncbi:hypothetical protein [Aquibacillus rhizosphaerae]|uniref:Phage protein n=1 Tax=Aquibacillus rhizosphaerae TaxID=3051431 RepID=A0ABT7L5V2_9BACI|nr:hypothetical protein [Aquibacillus sp. LR5S19]MDL4841230.1 hypothetical protein [Aquibacillus sp. LR5S19]
MRNNNKFEQKQKVTIKSTGETVTINKWTYVENMKRYSYTVEEYPNTFYFEEEIE